MLSIFVDPFWSGEAEMSSMGSMDSMFDAFDNSSVGDLLDIKNSVAFLSRVFGKNIPVFENLKNSKSWVSEIWSLRNFEYLKILVSEITIF